MHPKVFSKRHPEACKDVFLKPQVRQRIWYLLVDSDPYSNDPDWDLCRDKLAESLKREHGWQELRAYKTKDDWEQVSTQDFILRGVHRFILDATELFYDLLDGYKNHTRADPISYQNELNRIFEDANLPWRMLDGRIIRVDSKWLEEEIHAKASGFLSICGFSGAMDEFQQARSDLSSGDTKGAIHGANLALESTIKAILGIEQEKPGALIRKIIDSGLIPDYYKDFLTSFEDVLRSVQVARNFEKGVGHGQGTTVNDPPVSLAELAVNLAGVLILYLVKQYLEKNPKEEERTTKETNDLGDLTQLPHKFTDYAIFWSLRARKPAKRQDRVLKTPK